MLSRSCAHTCARRASGLWNISHNFGAFLAPLIAGTAALRLGWRYGVWSPAAIALVISAAVVAVVRDSPEALGRTDAESAWKARFAAEAVEEAEDEGWLAAMEKEAEAAMAAERKGTAEASADAVIAAASGGSRLSTSMGVLERLRANVLSKPQIWVLALAFLCVYLMRQVSPDMTRYPDPLRSPGPSPGPGPGPHSSASTSCDR